MESYQLDVIDYLLKPFGFDRFLQAVNKVEEALKLKKLAENADQEPDSGPKDFILVKADHMIHKIRFEDILYIQSMREYVAYHTTSGRILSLDSLKNLDKVLPNHLFLRIHKSYMVSKEKVTTLEGNMVHIGEEKLPIGKVYKEVVMKDLF